jgi:hypothetical protein
MALPPVPISLVSSPSLLRHAQGTAFHSSPKGCSIRVGPPSRPKPPSRPRAGTNTPRGVDPFTPVTSESTSLSLFLLRSRLRQWFSAHVTGRELLVFASLRKEKQRCCLNECSALKAVPAKGARRQNDEELARGFSGTASVHIRSELAESETLGKAKVRRLRFYTFNRVPFNSL